MSDEVCRIHKQKEPCDVCNGESNVEITHHGYLNLSEKFESSNKARICSIIGQEWQRYDGPQNYSHVIFKNQMNQAVILVNIVEDISTKEIFYEPVEINSMRVYEPKS